MGEKTASTLEKFTHLLTATNEANGNKVAPFSAAPKRSVPAYFHHHGRHSSKTTTMHIRKPPKGTPPFSRAKNKTLRKALCFSRSAAIFSRRSSFEVCTLRQVVEKASYCRGSGGKCGIFRDRFRESVARAKAPRYDWLRSARERQRPPFSCRSGVAKLWCAYVLFLIRFLCVGCGWWIFVELYVQNGQMIIKIENNWNDV